MLDPYLGCEEQCTHDLARGVLLEELLGTDGPHPPLWVHSNEGSGWVLSSVLGPEHEAA